MGGGLILALQLAPVYFNKQEEGRVHRFTCVLNKHYLLNSVPISDLSRRSTFHNTPHLPHCAKDSPYLELLGSGTVGNSHF